MGPLRKRVVMPPDSIYVVLLKLIYLLTLRIMKAAVPLLIASKQVI